MASVDGVRRPSESSRKELRQQRSRDRELVIRHRWWAGGLATILSASLLFSGLTPASAADEATPSPSASEQAAPEPTEAPAETPAPEESASPVEPAPPAEQPAPPAEEPAPPADEQALGDDADGAQAGDRSARAADEQTADTLDAGIGILSVPAPTNTSSVITVKVGSDRTNITGVTNLAGVVLLLNNGGGGGPDGVRPDGVAGTADGWAKCTSDAQGDCSFTVPNTQAGPSGVNRDARYWVIQSSVPPGYYANASLRTGAASGPGTSTPYRFRTGTQLRANTTYSSQDADDFMLASGSAPTASGGIWQQSRVNPTIAQSCGIDVALILDLSGSVGPSLPQLKQAADTFVNALQGTPSRMSLFSFSDVTPAAGANANFPNLTAVTTGAQATAFKNRYASWDSEGYTNWDRGLGGAAAANSVANNFDLAVIITDGNPTAYNQPAQGLGDNRFRETENGIFSANALKQGPAGAPAPTRVLAFGVGDGAVGAATALNLRAISGPTAYNGSNGNVADYFQTADYPAAGQALRNLALGNCQGSLTVTKQIVPSSAPAGSIAGATPAGAGWQFTSSISTAGVTTPTPVLTTTANGTGSISYPLTFPGGTTTGSVTVTEAQQAGFTLVPVNGQNAVCVNLNTGAPVLPTANPIDGFTVDVPSSAAVNCTVYNRAPNPAANLTVTKNWIINGVPFANGAQPSDFGAQLRITGPGGAGATNQGWGVTRTGYAVGDTATISEQVSLIDPSMCTNTAVVTNVNGTAVNNVLGAGFPITLTQAQNTATITNTVDCSSTLTLIKSVSGGSTPADSWTLNASFLATPSVPTGLPGFAGASGTPAVTGQIVTPNARYQLFEAGGDPRYAQVDNRTAQQSNPLSTGSATCIRVDAQGAPWPNDGYSDGINGGVSVPLGYRVACTIVNQTASLTLLKTVVNDNGGTTAASAWDLTATPAPLAGLTPTTVDGSEDAVPASTFQVRPDHVYTLTESSVPGYDFSKLQQLIDGAWVDVQENPDPTGYPQQDGAGNWSITVGVLDTPTYRFVNDDVAPKLTLVKTVTNDNGGTALPTAWTLTATAPGGPNLSGVTGTAGVTAQPVRAGSVYTIGETGGPAAYVWNTLSCTGYPDTTQAAPTITLKPGDDVTCTLNNNDVLVPVSVAKADGVVQQLPDGTWSISYQVVVTNGSETLPTTYSLTDAPAFDSSFTVLSQGWEGNPDVTDVAIEGGGSDTYTYVVTAESNETPVDPTALVCSPTGGGGFFNTATVTFPGGTSSDSGCAVPATPGVVKNALPAVQDAVTGAWTLSYEVIVSNGTGIPLAYTLDDTAAALPAGVTGGAWAASDPAPVGGGTFVRNAAWAGSGELATGFLPAGATHTYTVSRTVSVAATVTDAALTCGSVVNQGGGVWNTATVTNGIAEDDSSDCAEIERPGVTIAKTVTGTVQLADGTWEITYEVEVTNDSDDTAAVYNLADALQFGGDIVVDGASWTGPAGGGDFAPDGTATLATDRVIAGGDDETYTVTVRATVDADAWAGDTLTCQDDEGPSAGGFLNIATVTAAGTSAQADDCSEPALPTIQKVGVAASQNPQDPSRWLVSYDVTVTSGGYDTFYSLSDTPGYPVGVDLVEGRAQRIDAAGPVLTITSGADFVTGVPLAADAAHVYRVSWVVEVTDTADPDDAECTGQPGSGFFNTATLTVGDVPIDDSDCIPVDDRVYPTVTKTPTSTNQDPETGDWTITYDIDVTLAAQGPANPKGLAAEYDLEDTLDFGGDINIASAEWSGTSSGTFTGPDDTAILADDKAIAAGVTHTYTVTVVAEVTAEAIEDGTDRCASEEGGGGGFLNTAVLSSGGEVTPVEACAEPVFPEIDKSAVGDAVQNPVTGVWTLEYDITVTYPETDADPLPVLGYVLTDAPELPDGVELVGDWTASAADSDTPEPDDATWDGLGTWTIVRGTFDPDENDITEHVFTVTAEVRVIEPPIGEPEICNELEERGLVVINAATITSGGYTADDDACQVVHYDDVSLGKTAELAEGESSVEPGDEFDYVLTVTNNGTRPAEDVRVFDESFSVAPYVDRVEITGVVWAPDTLVVDDESDLPANIVDLTIAQLEVGESATITVSVIFLEAPESDAVEPGELPDPLDDLVNTACVETELDPIDGANGGNNCDTETVPTRDMTAAVYTTCLTDAPLLGFIVKTSANLADVEGTILWTPDNATPETVPASVDQSFTAGADGYEVVLDWPGSEFTPSGVAIDYPGWRPLDAADYGPNGGFIDPADGIEYPRAVAEGAGGFVFNGLILDDSELDYAWREPSTVVISVNPELTFAVEYPPATPECFVARHTEVQIEKTASKERMSPGDAFTYTIEAENVSDDSAAEGVVITDEIPANIRITDVSWVGESDPDAFPNYTDCGVTGQGPGGYGGTLTCTLFGPLQPAGADLGPSAAPVITLAAVSDPKTSATSIDNVAIVDYHTFGDPEDTGRDADNAVVYLSILAMTGSVLADGLIWAALLALLGGVLLVHVTRGRRQQGIARG
ncbi:MAG TPA: hypothetical protein VFY91_17955 [Microbacterium sp.]|nr:hypothetical protein [Microbacterium sp.]